MKKQHKSTKRWHSAVPIVIAVGIIGLMILVPISIWKRSEEKHSAIALSFGVEKAVGDYHARTGLMPNSLNEILDHTRNRGTKEAIETGTVYIQQIHGETFLFVSLGRKSKFKMEEASLPVLSDLAPNEVRHIGDGVWVCRFDEIQRVVLSQ